MAVYTVVDRKVIANIAAAYGLGKLNKASGVAAGSVNTHYLLETAKGKFFLKVDEVKSLSDAEQEVTLLLFLREHGFRCPLPLADRQGQYLTNYEGKPLSLYTALPGKILTEAQFTPEHLEQVGTTLATLHSLSRGYPKEDNNRFSFSCIFALYQHVKEKLPGYLRYLVHTLDDEVSYQQQYQEDRLPKGVIHGDLFADNLLFRAGKVVGVLDFEAACYGKFIYDLATAVNALCYVEGRFLIERFNALLAGYQRQRTLTLAEWDAFPTELRFSTLRFTITRLKDFFLRPMEENRRVNKDFREFFERLQVLRRERPGGMDRLLLAMATGYDYRQYQKPVTVADQAGVRIRTESRRTGGRRHVAPVQQGTTKKHARTIR
ncbi:MAG: homoserine kinase [Candidatus Binatia bacterium]